MVNADGVILHWCSVCHMQVSQTHESHIDGTRVTPEDRCRCETLPADFTVSPLDHARACPMFGAT
jgi:hypothetical protein